MVRNKYQLDSGTWVCKINISCKIKLTGQQSNETITLFTQNKEIYKKLKI